MTTRATPEDHDGTGAPSTSLHTTAKGDKAERLLRVDQVYSKKLKQIRFMKTAKAAVKLDRSGKKTLVVRRIINEQGMLERSEVDIKSSILKDLFLEIFGGVRSLELSRTPPMATPELFFHALPHFIERRNEENAKMNPDQAMIDDISIAVRFVEEDFGGQLTNRTSLLASEQITWDLLWAICPPKAVVIAPQHGPTRQMLGLNLTFSGYETRSNGSQFFLVEGAIITHDGEDFGWGHIRLEIDKYEGARPITSLPFYPLQHSNEREDVRKQLVARGRKYISIIGKPSCFEYATERATGANGVMETVLSDGRAKLEKFNARGRVMTDAEAYAAHNPSSQLNSPLVYPEYFISNRDLTEAQLVVCAYWINGFSFSAKIWGQFTVEDLANVAWDEEAFKQVVMKEERRKLIHGLVKAHRQDEASFDDIVPNKGRGLVCLFAGSPGVGKTLTAELVAETTQRPLYMVSTGELGIDADVVDKRLETILDITRRWGCVLLIDEADVFLSKRGQDLARDSLVSVFLRRLEYFRGVLVLTTNRQSEIDPAFESRIHIRISFPDLDEGSRAALWKNFINKALGVTDQNSIDEDDLSRLARRVLNGRQIKNAVSCAASLAREQTVPLTVEGIEALLEIITVWN